MIDLETWQEITNLLVHERHEEFVKRGATPRYTALIEAIDMMAKVSGIKLSVLLKLDM